MSISEDYDMWDGEFKYIPHEDNWKRGVHQTKEGKKYELSELTEDHLKNIITYFDKKYDVTPIKVELLTRGVNELINKHNQEAVC